MRPAGVQFGRKYLSAYHEKFRQSEPTEDAEDRLALYGLVWARHSLVQAILVDNI
jgi:protein-ribulosamine 3-kinase